MMNGIQIFLAGDSTVCDCPPNEEPRAGWGQLLQPFFRGNVKVFNHAVGGRSSNSFIEEGRLQPILEQLKPGDYLFVQFGHNDQKPIGTEPYTTYKSYLSQYIDGAYEKGAFPVLITPMNRRTFDEDGKMINSLGDYPNAMIELASERKVPLIDLWMISKNLYESMGPEESKKLFIWLEPGEHPNYPEGIHDDTHFCEEGAYALAEKVVEGIQEKVPLLASHLK